MATEAMVLHIDHFQRMATVINFQKKVRKKEENKEINNNSDSLVCDICFVSCKSKASLRHHRQRTHDDREFSCETCGKTVTGLNKFMSHKKTHETFSCPNCNENISLPNKSRHLKGCRSHECEICDFKTTTKDKLANHMKTHNRKVCSICGYQARNQAILDIHRQKQHIPSTKIKRPTEMFNCTWCTYSSSKKFNVDRHENVCPAKKRAEPIQKEPVDKADLSKLFAETNTTIRDFNKILRFFTNKFGSEWFAKKSGEAISEYCNSMNVIHASDPVLCVDKNGNATPRSCHYVSDILSLIDIIKEDPDFNGSPEIVISADSGMGKLMMMMGVYDEDGNGNMYILAMIDDVPEVRENILIMLQKVGFPFEIENIKFVADLKMMLLIIGLQDSSAYYSCPFGECYRIKFKDGKWIKTGEKGPNIRWVKGKDRTLASCKFWHEKWVHETRNLETEKEKRDKLKLYMSCADPPMPLFPESKYHQPLVQLLSPMPLHLMIGW